MKIMKIWKKKLLSGLNCGFGKNSNDENNEDFFGGSEIQIFCDILLIKKLTFDKKFIDSFCNDCDNSN